MFSAPPKPARKEKDSTRIENFISSVEDLGNINLFCYKTEIRFDVVIHYLSYNMETHMLELMF